MMQISLSNSLHTLIINQFSILLKESNFVLGQIFIEYQRKLLQKDCILFSGIKFILENQ